VTATSKKQQLSFEKALERLETIVSKMESGALNLDKMMQYFEEGMQLVQLCSEKLNEVEKKIEMLVKKEGKTTRAPFEMQSELTESKNAEDSNIDKNE